MKTVNEQELIGCMMFVRNMRAWAVQNNVDPWAVRQTLLIALHLDTKAALNRGIKHQDLQHFDRAARWSIGQWLKKHQ